MKLCENPISKSQQTMERTYVIVLLLSVNSAGGSLVYSLNASLAWMEFKLHLFSAKRLVYLKYH